MPVKYHNDVSPRQYIIRKLIASVIAIQSLHYIIMQVLV